MKYKIIQQDCQIEFKNKKRQFIQIKKFMEVKNISIKNNLNEIPDIENAWTDVYVTLGDGRTYIVQVITYQNFLESEDEKTINFISPIAPSIVVKELTLETIEAAKIYSGLIYFHPRVFLGHLSSEKTLKSL